MRTTTILITLMSKHKRRALFGAVALVAATVLFAATVSAQEITTSQDTQKASKGFTKTSKKPQSGDIAIQAENAHITAPNNPFRFRRAAKIDQITHISIIVTMRDGKTARGDIDHKDLFLALDGVKTPIELNGFRADHLDTGGGWSELTGWKHAHMLVNKLKKDGKLKATIIDRDPADDNRVSLPSNFKTTLKIQGKNR